MKHIGLMPTVYVNVSATGTQAFGRTWPPQTAPVPPKHERGPSPWPSARSATLGSHRRPGERGRLTKSVLYLRRMTTRLGGRSLAHHLTGHTSLSSIRRQQKWPSPAHPGAIESS